MTRHFMFAMEHHTQSIYMEHHHGAAGHAAALELSKIANGKLQLNYLQYDIIQDPSLSPLWKCTASMPCPLVKVRTWRPA